MSLAARERQRSRDGPRTLGRDFLRLKLGSRRLYLHKALSPYAGTIAARLSALIAERRIGAGNRGGVFQLGLNGVPGLFVRCARRGGLIRLLLSDLYFGPIPRPLRELKVSLEARRRGIAVAEPMGAMVEWAAPMVYRGCFLTRAIAGMTLWQFLQFDDDPLVRAHVLDQTRATIDVMHRRGLYHADLNLNNLFVTKIGESFTVVILDLDKARLYAPPLSHALVRGNLNRLARSARKLDPSGRYLDASALSRLTAESGKD